MLLISRLAFTGTAGVQGSTQLQARSPWPFPSRPNQDAFGAVYLMAFEYGRVPIFIFHHFKDSNL